MRFNDQMLSGTEGLVKAPLHRAVMALLFPLVPAGHLDSNLNPIRRGNCMAKRKKKVTVTQMGKKAFAYLVKRGFWRAR
jgi:hypothetical protein